MGNGGILFGVTLTMVVVIAVMVIINFGMAVEVESIKVTVLDDICQQLTNETNATFRERFPWQSNFPCRVGNTITIFGTEG